MYSPMLAARACCLHSPSETEVVPLKDAANAHTRRFECMHAWRESVLPVLFDGRACADGDDPMWVSRRSASGLQMEGAHSPSSLRISTASCKGVSIRQLAQQK